MDKRGIAVSRSFSGINEKPTEIDVLIDKSKQPETGNAGTRMKFGVNTRKE
jgi:hypothetical protein